MAVGWESESRLSFDDAEHLADGFLEPYEQGAGDDGEPDGYFVNVGDSALKQGVILIIQPMAGMYLQAQGVGMVGRRGEAFGFGKAGTGRAGVGVVARMEFDAGGAGFRAGVDLFQDRVDKKGDVSDAGVKEPAGDKAEAALMSQYIEPAFRGDFLASLGHQRRQMRPDFATKRDHFVIR